MSDTPLVCEMQTGPCVCKKDYILKKCNGKLNHISFVLTSVRVYVKKKIYLKKCNKILWALLFHSYVFCFCRKGSVSTSTFKARSEILDELGLERQASTQKTYLFTFYQRTYVLRTYVLRTYVSKQIASVISEIKFSRWKWRAFYVITLDKCCSFMFPAMVISCHSTVSPPERGSFDLCPS